MTVRIFQVDAFTDKPFAGNPAAVCILPAARDEIWMQNVAREMNLSETAFLIDEDPVTGSAHCCLGPFWSRRFGKNDFTAYQASERGGIVGVRVVGDRVYLRGRSVTVLRGKLIDAGLHLYV